MEALQSQVKNSTDCLGIFTWALLSTTALGKSKGFKSRGPGTAARLSQLAEKHDRDFQIRVSKQQRFIPQLLYEI